MSNPVFNDTSGTRVATIQWGSRILLVVMLLLGAAVALTLRSHVDVPGLERLLPVLDSQELRPAVRSRAATPSAERPAVRTELGRFQPRATEPAGRPAADTAEPEDTRRAIAPSTTNPTVQPSGASSRTAGIPTRTADPTASASPPVRTGAGAVKPRNPKAATPSPRNSQAPGQNRVPKPKSPPGIG